MYICLFMYSNALMRIHGLKSQDTCTYVYKYTSEYVYLYTYIYWMYIYLLILILECADERHGLNSRNTCMYAYTCTSVWHIYIYMYIYTYTYICLYMCINTCFCIFLYTYINSHVYWISEIFALQQIISGWCARRKSRSNFSECQLAIQFTMSNDYRVDFWEYCSWERDYGVATVSRLLKIIDLICRISSLL